MRQAFFGNTFSLLSNPALRLQATQWASRGFVSQTKKIGLNDHLKDAKKEAKKYGIKRRFYDHLPTIAR